MNSNAKKESLKKEEAMREKEDLKVKWLDPIDLELEDKISRSRQSVLRAKRLIPFYRRGRYIRYKRKDIDAWWEDAKVV